MKVRGGILLALVACLAAAVASTAGAGSTTAARSQAVSCKGTLKMGFAAPFTGGAAFLGNEQLSWAKYAVKTLAPKYGLKISLVTGDIPVETGPAGALTVAQKFAADKNVVVMLVVEQNANVSLSIADRGYVLSTGRVVLEGKAADLLQDEGLRKAYLGR